MCPHCKWRSMIRRDVATVDSSRNTVETVVTVVEPDVYSSSGSSRQDVLTDLIVLHSSLLSLLITHLSPSLTATELRRGVTRVTKQ